MCEKPDVHFLKSKIKIINKQMSGNNDYKREG